MEKLISDAVKSKSDKLEAKLPRADMVWKKIQEQKRLANEKKRKKRDFGIAGWLEIAAVLLIITVLPVTITKLRNSPAGQITPSSKQETVATQAELEEAKKTASRFLTDFYTIEDYNSFTQQDERLYPNDNKTKGMRSYTTDNYYMTLVASRDLLFIIKAAQNNKCNFYVDEINLIKYTEDMKNKSIVFTSDVYLKCKFKDGSEKPGSFRGQIIMVNENGKWKVNHYQVTNSEPKEIFTNIFDDKTNWVIQNLLPHPYDPEIQEKSMLFKGKWAGSVIPEFTAEMEKMGWRIYDGMGAKKFYKKEVNGGELIKISIIPKEQGGPEEKDATTIITVKVEN